MIVKKTGLCELKNEMVEVTLNQPARRKAVAVPLACSKMASCPRTAFCRLVNPLTVRVPVRYDVQPSPEAAPVAMPEQAS